MKKSTRWILAVFVLAFLLFSALGITLGILFLSRKTVLRRPQVMVYEVPMFISEYHQTPGLGSIVGPPPVTLMETVKAIRNAANDSNISALVLRISTLGMGWAKIQELRDAIEVFRESGKPLYAYLEMSGNREYYLATAAEKVLMPPETIATFGLLSETTFYREMLRNVKVEPQLLHVGKYKSASDILMRETMTEEHRENVNSLLDSIYGQFVDAIVTCRNLDRDTTEEVLDQGLLSPQELKNYGFVDDVIYPDELYGRIWEEKNLDARDKKNRISLRDYATNGGFGFPSGQRIAVIVASGSIAWGESSYGGWTEMIGSETVSKQLRKVREDNRVAAVVLRIDSPGGSGFASDLIWREVQLTTNQKPVVVSMSDVAASGGYYIAMGANHIVTQPATLTGSIGVIAGKVVLNDLYDWAGMNIESIKRGENADLFTVSQGFDEKQRKILGSYIEDFYDTFVHKAAEGREMTWEEMHELAQGRVWTGEQAVEKGLADQLGGLSEAIAQAKNLSGLPLTEPVPLDVYPKRKTFFEMLSQMDQTQVLKGKIPRSVRRIVDEAATLKTLEDEPLLTLMPFRVVIK